MLQSTIGATLPSRPVIGVFDSGLGGLSVVRELLSLAPGSRLLYVGDRAHAPYGDRSPTDIRARAEIITDHLLGKGAELIVIACNSASGVALDHLRARHPDVPFVGMEPAVKPAAALTSTGIIGVLATPATLAAEPYASVVGRFAGGVAVLDVPCPGWIDLVEYASDPGRRAALVAERVAPAVARGADVLVLGCTHYPFLTTEISAAAGEGVTIVDPGVAVARQILRVCPRPELGPLEVDVTGPVDGVADRIADLTGLAPPVRTVPLPHSVH